MIKYTANYTYTNPNFVIQNLEKRKSQSDLLPLLLVIKNILQRGFPTVMSKYLQKRLGAIQETENYEQRLLLVPKSAPKWSGVIKGSEEKQYNPAREFLETIIPAELREYSFIQSMILPEVPINEIVGIENQSFVNQKVDFYLPQALLVIEIDGSQHRQIEQCKLDNKRNSYLLQYGILTIRITTDELQHHRYEKKIEAIRKRLEQYENGLKHYRMSFEKVKDGTFSEDEIHDKLLPTAIIRFQLLFLDLLTNDYIQFGKHWKFNIKCDEPLKDFAKLAIEDVYVWLDNLVRLRDKHEQPKFDYEITVCKSPDFELETSAVNVDFSLLQRYSDENELEPKIIFVRTDYFDFSEKRIRNGKGVGIDKNYFCVSTAPSIDYQITDTDKPILRFFLRNLFNKHDFRDGQFAIISNALNMRDTIGLLPTGGGKSLCFQMPCLLQPTINFVVCPIKSLMYDQIDNLQRGDVRITNINLLCGDQEAEERNQIMRDYSQGKYLFIWISPERFQIQEFRESIKAIINQFNISYAVVDEVHCMSEWGHDFRTSYLNLAKTIDNISPKDETEEGCIKFIGLTATASVNVLKDIKVEFSRRKQQLEDDNIKTLIDYTRPELDFVVVDDKQDKESTLLQLLDEIGISSDHSKAVLVFTPHVNGKSGCFMLADTLNKYYPNQVAWYSGSCPNYSGQKGKPLKTREDFDKYKKNVQAAFKDDKYQVLCATKAFGMGIDKQNIFYTFHYGLPGSVEALYQEAGRAGRWDKSLPENKGKRGKCYVLHSHETPVNMQYADQIFAPNVGVATIKGIMKNVQWSGRDIFTQLFLFTSQIKAPDVEYDNIVRIIDMFYEKGAIRKISYNDFQQYLTPDDFEKEIYRLCLLGIADDWTRDFKSSFTVKFNTTDSKHIVASLKDYILKYAPDEKVEENINAVCRPNCDTLLKKAVWYLLDWIFQHITESRKQSLKTLSDWCLDYKDSDSFKQHLDSYFTFNDSTYVLQHIAEHSDDYAQWFAPFYWVDKEGKKSGKFITHVEVIKLRDRLSRFLESYHDSPGLNFVSGMVRLILGDFEDTDGRPRMESALKAVAEANADNLMGNGFVQGVLQFLKDANLASELSTEICTLIARYFPSLLSQFADELRMPWLYNDLIKEKVNLLRNLNIMLYESIGRIY